MDLDDVTGMLVEIGLGHPKAESRFRDRAEFGVTWDALVAESRAIVRDGGEVAIPSEMAPADRR